MHLCAFKRDGRVEVPDSVARFRRTPPYAARRKGLNFGISRRLRSESHRSTVVVGNYAVWTDSGGTSPGQSNPLYASVDPVSAPQSLPTTGVLVEPPGTAPGSDPLITSAFMSIVPFPEHCEYKGCEPELEGLCQRLRLRAGSPSPCAQRTRGCRANEQEREMRAG